MRRTVCGYALLSLAVMLACFRAETAKAGIISTTGAIDVLASPPPSVLLTTRVLFFEQDCQTGQD